MKEQASLGAAVHTDTSSSYPSMKGFAHNAVNNSASVYLRGTAHTNSIESSWSLFKRGLYGTYQHMSGHHVQRYLAECTGRHNACDLDRADQMGRLAVGLSGQRLPWKMLTDSARLPAAA